MSLAARQDRDERLPPLLAAVREQVDAQRRHAAEGDGLRPVWSEHVSRVVEEVAGVHCEDEGEVLYAGTLSRGCRACKDGTWDCIFLTLACNLNCAFCFSPKLPRDYVGSTFGNTPEEIAANHGRTRIEGISFSGGEPFLQPEKLFSWLEWFKRVEPDKYYWVYTNGLLVEPAHLTRLGQLGLDEIRFNAAASSYASPPLLETMAQAARVIPNVTVEIPAIPEHAPRLLAALAPWEKAGVRFLNLHELLYEPGTNAASLPRPRRAFLAADGHRTHVHPGSRALTLAVMKKVHEDGLALSVNDCSLQGKLRQLRGRRCSLAPLVKQPYEKLVDDTLESCCAYLGAECRLFHPDSLEAERQAHPGYRFARLARIAPLYANDSGRWISLQAL